MADLYLIAHKVRGERAFDVAEPLEMPDTGDVWWIIPTSGHRAYPYWQYKLSDLFAYPNVGDPPEGLRDHYAVMPSESPRAGRASTPSAVPKLEDI